MLKLLKINNYALIESLEIDFRSGLNILTGETGTGKSIILGALGLILGDRARTDMIRKGADRAVVEAWIEIPKSRSTPLPEKFREFIVSEKELIIRREVQASGRSRCFIDDSPVPLNLLSELGDRLIDLHGQHEHQALFKTENHLLYLDNYGHYESVRTRVKSLAAQYRDKQKALKESLARESVLKEKQELLAFQVQEIEKVNPKPGEDENLASEEGILRNAEKLNETVQNLEKILYSGEGAVVEKLSIAKQQLIQHASLDNCFSKWGEECDTARITVQELFTSVQGFVTQIEYNPQHLEQIRNRLGQIQLLIKKYGGSLDKVLLFYENAKQELQQIEHLDVTISEKRAELETIRKEFSRHCVELSDLRKQTGLRLSEAIVHKLKELGLSHSEMKIQIQYHENPEGPVTVDDRHYAASESGMDHIEFLISLNPGETPKPLRHVASGGEISRIMLAIKTILAESDDMPILVFDEIDTGISGRIARVVGHNLKDVSLKRQVICITHLPQIASMGDLHFTVDKEVHNGRTRTLIRKLNEENRIIEIAKLLGGETITENTLQSARELLL